MAASFGEKFRKLREVRGVSQSELSRRLGYTNNGYISNIESGDYRPSEDKLREIARAMDVPFDWMKEMLLESRLEDMGIREPGFVSMLKDYPQLTREDRKEIIRAYIKVKSAKYKKRSDGHGQDH